MPTYLTKEKFALKKLQIFCKLQTYLINNLQRKNFKYNYIRYQQMFFMTKNAE